MQTNKENKDSVFAKYFNEDTKQLVKLYNAVYGASYPEDTKIEVDVLGDVLNKAHLNDLYFVLDKQLVVFVEQSADDDNMTLRVFVYLGRLYEKLLGFRAMYKHNQIPLLEPKFVVLYNGTDDLPQHSQQNLSNIFANPSVAPGIKLTVDIWNLNYSKENH